MSDRIKGFTVELACDLKDEDFQQIKDAVEMIKGVQSITESVVTSDDYINRSRIKNELMGKIYDLLKEDF